MKTRVGIVAIVGRANVGKSTLFNSLIGRRETITAAEPGTTRDMITAMTSYGGKDFWLADTAGIKSAEDDFETTIQEQISQSAEAADVIIIVTDSRISITAEDRQAAKLALKSKTPVVLAVNKVDTFQDMDLATWRQLGIKEIIPVSALHKLGLDSLLASIVKHLPEHKILQPSELIRLAIIGRPNVGKSSLFNTLAQKQQALVADRAGTTRDVNRINIKYHSKEIQLLDTAGIRRSGKVARGVEHFSVLRSLAAIQEADICLLLLDVLEPITHLDQKLAGIIKDSGKGLVLALNKYDLLDHEQVTPQRIASQLKSAYDFIPWAPLLFTSAITGENANRVFSLVLEISDNRQAKFKPAQLNRWLRNTTAHHPPAGVRGRRPSLKFIVQETDQPLPSFKIFGTGVNFLHWSYRRYLEHSFRESWSLVGTPIQFWMIEDKR